MASHPSGLDTFCSVSLVRFGTGSFEPNGMTSHPMGLILDTIRSTSSISDANEHWEHSFVYVNQKGWQMQ